MRTSEVPWSEQFKREYDKPLTSTSTYSGKEKVFIPPYERTYILSKLGIPQSLVTGFDFSIERQLWFVNYVTD